MLELICNDNFVVFFLSVLTNVKNKPEQHVTGLYYNIFQLLKSRSRIKNSKVNYERGMSQNGNMDSQ